jgi:putative redox protein
MTVRRFAERKGWPVTGMQARMTLASTGVTFTAIDVELIIEGDLDPEQRARLHEVAKVCPVSKALAPGLPITLTAATSSSGGR